MKFTIGKLDFLDILSKVQGITERKSTIPILSNILIEAKNKLKVAATDLEVSVEIVSSASVDSQGITTVPSKLLYNIIKELPNEDVKLELMEDNQLHVHCGRSNFRLSTIDPGEFPKINFESVDLFKIDAQLFKNALERVAFAASQDDTKIFLKSVYIEADEEDIIFTSTDGNRLAYTTLKKSALSNTFNISKSLLIPRKSVIEISKLLSGLDDAMFGSSDRYVIVKTGSTSLLVRLIDGLYPSYHAVMKGKFVSRVTIPRIPLLESIKRVSFIAEKSNGVLFILDDKKLRLVTSNTELGGGEEELDIDFKGKVQLGLNYRYVLDYLNIVQDDNVDLLLQESGDKAALFTCDSEKNEKYLVMPMKVRLPVI